MTKFNISKEESAMLLELISAYGRIASGEALAFLRELILNALSIDTKGHTITGLLARSAVRAAAVPLLASAIALAASPAVAQDRE
ncbi:hypothetical protein [Bradyrhizobium niftali]|uniref:hypothetical protein n=1 Tax=Bradyrhizobium niftali TaxID=2560055 RepID=UPI003D3178A7